MAFSIVEAFIVNSSLHKFQELAHEYQPGTNDAPNTGTFITEWNSGRQLCRKIFSSTDTALRFASQLGAMARAYKFEGWLVNIENPLESASAVRSIIFTHSTHTHT